MATDSAVVVCGVVVAAVNTTTTKIIHTNIKDQSV